MKLHSKINIRLLFVVILIMGVYSLFAYFVPVAIDDFSFMRYYIDAKGGDRSFSFSGLANYFVSVRQLENGRLANYLCAPVVLWIPRWLWALILGGIITTCVALTARLSSGWKKFSARILIFVWALTVVFMPWNDFSGLMVADYALNYLFAWLLVLLTIIFLIRVSRSRMYVWAYCLALICAFAAGMIHETVSLCMIATFGLIAVSKRFKLSSQWWGLFIAIILGETLCLTAPGIMSRIKMESSNFELPTLYVLIRHAYHTILLFSICSIAAIITSLTNKGRNRLRGIFRSQINIYMGLFALIVSVSVIILQAPMRFSLFSTGPTIIVLTNVLSTRTKFFNYFAQIGSGIVLVGILLFYSVVIHWQRKIYNEEVIVIETIARANGKPVYFDMTRNAPWYTFSYPIDGLWYIGAHQDCVAKYVKALPDVALVLPKAVEHFEIAECLPLDYSDHSGYYQIDDYLIADGKLDINSLPSQLRYRMNDGRERGSATSWRIFFDDIGNKWYIGVPLRGGIYGPYVRVVDAR